MREDGSQIIVEIDALEDMCAFIEGARIVKKAPFPA
jgi:hypothetical protein